MSFIKGKQTGNKWLLLLPTFLGGSLGDDAQDFMGGGKLRWIRRGHPNLNLPSLPTRPGLQGKHQDSGIDGSRPRPEAGPVDSLRMPAETCCALSLRDVGLTERRTKPRCHDCENSPDSLLSQARGFCSRSGRGQLPGRFRNPLHHGKLHPALFTAGLRVWTHLACSSGSFLCLCMWNMRSPPLTYSMTRNNLAGEKGKGSGTKTVLKHELGSFSSKAPARWPE